MDQDRIAQLAAFVAAVIIGILTYFKGGKPGPDETQVSAEQIELGRLRDQVIEERNRRIAEEIKSVRDDFEKIIGSLNVSLKTQLEAFGHEMTDIASSLRTIDERLHAAERKLDVVDDRQKRSERR